MSHSPSLSDGSAAEPNLDAEKVRELFANVLGLQQTLGDHVPSKDVADDADVLKTMLGASAEELEPAPRPTGDDQNDNESGTGSPGSASPKAATAGSSVKPTIAKVRRVPPPSTLSLSTSIHTSGSKTGKRTIGAPSSKPIATTGDAAGDASRNNPCEDSDGDDVFQSFKYDSDGSEDEASVANKSSSSRPSKKGASKRAPRRPKKKESDTEKAARILREREETRRAQRLQKTQMRSKQLTRRHSALEVLDGLIPLGIQQPKIGFTRQHMVEHSFDRLSQKKAGLADATLTATDKDLNLRVCAYLEKDPEAPMTARDLVCNKIDALRKASNVPGTIGVLEMRRTICDPNWLPIDDALHKRKDASHNEFRKLEGAMRELKQDQEINAKQVTKRQAWLAAALDSAPK